MASFHPAQPLTCALKFGTLRTFGDLGRSGYEALPSVVDGVPFIKVRTTNHGLYSQFSTMVSSSGLHHMPSDHIYREDVQLTLLGCR